MSVWLLELMNACSVLFLWGILSPTTPVNKLTVKLRSQRMCVVRHNLYESVSNSSVTDWLKRFLLSASHSPSLSDDFCQPVPVLLWSVPPPTPTPPQQTQPKVRTLLIVDKKNTWKISSRILNDLSFLRRKRREWTFLMISSVFSCQASLLSITKPK